MTGGLSTPVMAGHYGATVHGRVATSWISSIHPCIDITTHSAPMSTPACQCMVHAWQCMVTREPRTHAEAIDHMGKGIASWVSSQHMVWAGQVWCRRTSCIELHGTQPLSVPACCLCLAPTPPATSFPDPVGATGGGRKLVEAWLRCICRGTARGLGA